MQVQRARICVCQECDSVSVYAVRSVSVLMSEAHRCVGLTRTVAQLQNPVSTSPQAK